MGFPASLPPFPVRLHPDDVLPVKHQYIDEGRLRLAALPELHAGICLDDSNSQAVVIGLSTGGVPSLKLC